MQKLLKNTYLLNNKGIKKDIDRLWEKYSTIVESKKTTWEEINEARAINYLMHIYIERIAPEMMQLRLNRITPRIRIEEFLFLVDTKQLDKINKDQLLLKLAEYYEIIKRYKNKIKNDSFHNEKIFLEKYEKLKPKDFI
ncbi:hypothetical protein HNV12_02035 [Methanococcoides sp. SA1]|nr:hypothetical protein [Methanococcoides sp. SA1]